MATPTTKPDELAAPLDLLLTSATRPFARRMMPDATWARLGVSLAKQPGAVAGRVGALVRELGSVVAGRSNRAPARVDKRFTDPAWQSNPLLRRLIQAYLVRHGRRGTPGTRSGKSSTCYSLQSANRRPCDGSVFKVVVRQWLASVVVRHDDPFR
jgi:hypothetical protein